MARNNKSNSSSLTLLRVVIGVIFAYHGYIKLFPAGGFSGTVTFFQSVGIPLAKYAALLVGGVEFFGGLLLIFGVLMRLASFFLIINMLVALFKVHIKNGLLLKYGGSEVALVLLAGLFVLFGQGPGKFTVKSLFKKR